MNQANDASSRRMQRNRKLLPGLVAAGALAAAAGIGACSSAAPTTEGATEGATHGATEGASASTSQAESADDCASTPFASAATCTTRCFNPIGTGSGGGSGIKVQSIHAETTTCITNCTCPSVTNPPTPAPPDPDGGTGAELIEAISPPAALAGLGCTEGASFSGPTVGRVWACPVGSAIPGDFGDEPLCAEEDASVPICWSIMTATAVSDNPVVGNPLPGWMLVFELNGGTGLIASDGTCQGGCPPPGCTGGCPVPIDPTPINPTPIHLTY